MTATTSDASASPADEVRVPTIAIIGMEGSGKTVLTTTLAKRLSTIDEKGMFLNPQGVATLRYVERVWNTLQSEDWPPSTPPGELFELKWKFQIVGDIECDIRLIDAAGQDLRLLFGDEQFSDIESLPKQLRVLAEYCRTANIILFLINLKDFIGVGDSELRTSNEAAIKSAMDYLGDHRRSRRVCLILTQADLYRHLADQYGGWASLAAEAVPYVFSAHVRLRELAVYPVSAVADTDVVVDDTGAPRRVPVTGFRSEGLGELVEWLADQVREVRDEAKWAVLEQAASVPETSIAIHLPARSETPPTVKGEPHHPLPLDPQAAIPAICIIVVLAAAMLWGCWPERPPPRPVRPIAEFSYRWEPDPGVFIDGIKVFITVRNKGAPGKIQVYAQVWEKGALVETQSRDFYLGAGQAATHTFQMNKIYSLNNPHRVEARAAVP